MLFFVCQRIILHGSCILAEPTKCINAVILDFELFSKRYDLVQEEAVSFTLLVI